MTRQAMTQDRQQTTPQAFLAGVLQRKCACGQSLKIGSGCEACRQDRDRLLQRHATDSAPVPDVPPVVLEVLGSPGRPLEPATRTFMEPRFGHNFSQVAASACHRPAPSSKMLVDQPASPFETEAEMTADAVRNSQPSQGVLELGPGADSTEDQPRRDFSGVQVHSDTRAAEAAGALNAEAFTLGSHIVFGAGRYAPNTPTGMHLLAHELTHYVQQNSGPEMLQRKLVVNPNHPPPSITPASDPAAALTPAQRFAMMDTLIQGLCPEFQVESATGEVLTKSLTSLDSAEAAAGAKPVGCCCLNVLTSSPDTWTIQVTQVAGPHTRSGSREVILNATTSPVEFGSFTAAGGLAFQGNVPAAGHELCGHAALLELKAHPSNQSRTQTDVHDPTVRLENLISTEQGVPTSDLRGLAASGPHRGESVDRITIQNYAFNSTNVPASELSKIQFAAAYIIENDSFVDVLGHSDAVGSHAAKKQVSEERAKKVKKALTDQAVPTTITKHGLTNVSRFTRVEGVSDTQPPAGALIADPANWRRTEILIAGFPAGAQKPPPGTPATVTPHVQNPNVPGLKGSADPCVSLLVGGAYP